MRRLPNGPDVLFDGGGMCADYDTVCAVKTISIQIDSSDSMIVTKKSSKDKIISTVMRFTDDEWPYKNITKLLQ